VLAASVKSGEGLQAVRDLLHDRVTVVTGPSGAGKSSLANALEPGLALRVSELSQKAERGRQTTVSAVMVPMSEGGYLVDTPGFSEVGLWGVVPRELARCFPEMLPWLDDCRFPDCTHRSEPGCAVRAAVERGDVAEDRYASYRTLYEELESAPEEWE
jgi:ribosome biogenesis GTPase